MTSRRAKEPSPRSPNPNCLSSTSQGPAAPSLKSHSPAG